MGELRVSDRADADLLDIYLFGAEQFGRLQAVNYQMSLKACFDLLADNPRLGRTAPLIGPDVRRHEHGSHVILYQVDENGVLIIAVVHGRNLSGLHV